MSYRTYADGVQIFGNNEYYPEWFEFLKTQGIKIDEENCYEGDITDFMGAVSTIENIVMRLHKEREEMIERHNGNLASRPIVSLFDLRHIPKQLAVWDEYTDKTGDTYTGSLLDELMDQINNGYVFMPYTFYLVCQEKLEPTDAFSTAKHFHCYQLKDGEKIHIVGR